MQKTIGRDAALAMAETEWWVGKTPREIVEFQLFTTELCCPFGVFQKAVEESLGRSVFTHEFALNYDGICAEFLGTGEPPTLEDIIGMIPEEKRLLVVVDNQQRGLQNGHGL